MAKYEHGVYEPPQDDLKVYDGAEGDFDDEGSRLPLLIAIALLVLAAFGGVVWIAYNQGLQRGREDAPRIIAAEQGPIRTAPQNPGGATPYKGLKIYEQPAPPDEETDNAASAQPAATPSAEPRPEAPAPAFRSQKPASAASASAKIALAKQAPAASVPASMAPATMAASGTYVLQIGAYKSETEANAAWIAFQRKHPLVGGYATDIQKADLGSKGIWYRLRIGSFDNRAAAGALCDKLKADGGNCFPAKF